MTLVHLFNSSSLSGPERLVVPVLAKAPGQFAVMNLVEERLQNNLTTDPLAHYARASNLPYCAIRVRRRFDAQGISELAARLGEMRPALVHAHAVKASVYLTHAVRAANHKPLCVSTHHGVLGLPDWKTRLYEWVYRKWYLPRYDRVLAVSSADYQLLRHSGLADESLRLHLNGGGSRVTPFGQRVSEAARIRARWLPNEKDVERYFLMGVVGRLSKEKDHARLLRILVVLNAAQVERPWKCLIFGDGALSALLRQRFEEAGLTDRVVWMGYRSQVGEELAGLNLLISLSKAEGLPMNILEAGCAGTPVLATRVGGVGDVMADERFGITIDPSEPPPVTAERLRQLLRPSAAASLAAWGQQLQDRVTKEFSQEKWMERLQEIYKELDVSVVFSR